jgi:hypothetical protein
MTRSAEHGAVASQANRMVNWNSFPSAEYYDRNYSTLHDADAQIIELLIKFFRKVDRRNLDVRDVGTGTNLYPALVALPYARTIHLNDYSLSNMEWLHHNLQRIDPLWHEAWALVTELSRDHRATDATDAIKKEVQYCPAQHI